MQGSVPILAATFFKEPEEAGGVGDSDSWGLSFLRASDSLCVLLPCPLPTTPRHQGEKVLSCSCFIVCVC
jgi:hypothetical protein